MSDDNREQHLVAVWAAAYVRILSATPPSFPSSDHGVIGVAEALGSPTDERVRIAVRGADATVEALRQRLKL